MPEDADALYKSLTRGYEEAVELKDLTLKQKQFIRPTNKFVNRVDQQEQEDILNANLNHAVTLMRIYEYCLNLVKQACSYCDSCGKWVYGSGKCPYCGKAL